MEINLTVAIICICHFQLRLAGQITATVEAAQDEAVTVQTRVVAAVVVPKVASLVRDLLVVPRLMPLVHPVVGL